MNCQSRIQLKICNRKKIFGKVSTQSRPFVRFNDSILWFCVCSGFVHFRFSSIQWRKALVHFCIRKIRVMNETANSILLLSNHTTVQNTPSFLTSERFVSKQICMRKLTYINVDSANMLPPFTSDSHFSKYIHTDNFWYFSTNSNDCKIVCGILNANKVQLNNQKWNSKLLYNLYAGNCSRSIVRCTQYFVCVCVCVRQFIHKVEWEIFNENGLIWMQTNNCVAVRINSSENR